MQQAYNAYTVKRSDTISHHWALPVGAFLMLSTLGEML